ncbi:Long-chain-alcohol dehydrogenase 1 [subsurface metagenome]|jgi:alcohol dehydrogenase class IV
MKSKLWLFRTPGNILFGNDAAKEIGKQVRRLHGTNALVITDKGLVQAGIAAKIENLLKDEGIKIAVFDEVEPDPSVEVVEKSFDFAKQNDYDVIVGLGGGSSIDIAKITSIMLTNKESIHNYFGVEKISKPGIPTIMLPTTAGTGAEVTPNAIFTDTKEKLKKGIVSHYLFPTVAIIDPLLTVSMPPSITASTGIDALTHAIESYISVNSSNITDMFAEKAISLICNNIRIAFARGGDVGARYRMCLGSMYAGVSLANAGVGAVHALAYPLGGQFHIPHGVANACMLPYVMEFNAFGCMSKVERILSIVAISTEGLSFNEKTEKFTNFLKDLNRDLKIPLHLREQGVDKDSISQLGEFAVSYLRLLKNNPRDLTVKDAIAIYKAAF